MGGGVEAAGSPQQQPPLQVLLLSMSVSLKGTLCIRVLSAAVWGEGTSLRKETDVEDENRPGG